MQEELMLKAIEINQKGYSCSQTVFLLSTDFNQVENPELVKALDGLAYGMHTRKTCGCLSGALCLASFYLGKDANMPRDERLQPIAQQLTQWFEEQNGSSLCDDILKKHNEDKASVCPRLMAETFKKCFELLMENDVDVYNV